MKLRHTSLLLLSLSAGLVACRPTPAPDPLAAYTGQTLNWTACDPTILGEDQTKLFGALGDRLRCADMTVPANWTKPNGTSMSVSLIRVAAANQSKRQGAIFFNPGGPGGDGLAFAPYYASFWENEKNPLPNAEGLKQMAGEFDLIGFSPRGVGASSRLYCGSNELADPINPPAADRSEKNIAALIRYGKLTAQACQKNPITPLINTDATARDLNLARQLIGDQKLNYIGYSYGTWLGSWYAKLFPEHTGRMLLDGNMSWNESMEDAFGLQPAAFERDFRDSVAPYLARQNEVLGLGDSGAKVYAAQNSLSEPLRSIMGNYIAQLMYGRDQLPFIGLLLKPAVVIDGVIKANPQASLEELLALSAKQTYFPIPELNAMGAELAQMFLFQRDQAMRPTPFPVEMGSFESTFTAITCNDTPWKQTLAGARARDDQDAKNYPLIGGGSVANACLQWKGGPSVQKPGVPANMPPILMLQNELDPATPQEGALRALNSTPSAKMIFIDDEPQHAAFPYGTTCVDKPIIDYFLTGKMPEGKMTTCTAMPLPMEDKVVPVKTLSVQSGALCVAQPGLSAQSLSEQRLTVARTEARRIIEDNARAFFLPKVGTGLKPEALKIQNCR
ncbi:alpha/beta hydrolase [Deinococcus multiflagellatus]|uniref:alpha/beta hydrolase n=1 Tax=Deinococcus multiflagellatus TaxID=1656887 RepID=UPI001CC9C7D5|nr:alpha/beta hydrolase [Deinococcus multiflagellatus]MBZ9716070.1 alpha/beta hydrolase [Deinococcus multiflagellatus]